MARLTLSVGLCLLILAGTKAQGTSEGETSPCAAILCAPGTLCTVNEKGGPQCVPVAVDNYNPCAATTCLVGNDCIVNERGEAECVPAGGAPNPCAFTTCLVGNDCIVNDKGEAECVPAAGSEAPNPCAATTCLVGNDCIVNEKGEAECVPAAGAAGAPNPCAATTCLVGNDCIVNEKGEAECVPVLTDPCAATTCPVGNLCIVNEGGEPECVEDPCYEVTCDSGRACFAGKDGKGVCEEVFTSQGCERACPEGKVCSVKGDSQLCVEDKCPATTCPVNHTCMMQGTEPACVEVVPISAPVDPPCNKACTKDKACRVVNGEERCVRLPKDPCAATTCAVGSICVPEGQGARCVSACAVVRCRSGYHCKTDKNGFPGCIKKRPSCRTKECGKGKRCKEIRKKPRCISKCTGRKCGRGRRCIINKRGNSQCVRK